MQAESFTLVEVSIAGAVTAVVTTPVSMPGSLAPWGEKPGTYTGATSLKIVAMPK